MSLKFFIDKAGNRFYAQAKAIFEVDALGQYVFSFASGTAYTLTAAVGTLTLSAQSATFLRSLTLAAGKTNLTLTAKTATMVRAIGMAAAKSNLTLSAQSATMARALGMAAAKTNLTLSAQSATILRSLTFGTTVGNLTLSSKSADLTIGKVLEAGTGALTLGAESADLSYTPAGGIAYTLDAATGILALSSESAALTVTPFPVQKPQQLVGMGGTWYSYRQLFAKAKKRLEEQPAFTPFQKPEPEPSTEFVSAMTRLGARPRREVTFTSLDLSNVREAVTEHETIAAKRTVRRRREREVIEV